MKEHPIDKLFKDKFEGSEINPSPSVWSRIEHQLEDDRKPLGYWLSIAATIILLVALFSFIFLNQESQVIEEQISNQPVPVETHGDERPKSIQPAGTMPGSDSGIPIMAQQDQSETAKKHTSLGGDKLALAEFEGDERQFSDQTIWPIDPIKYEPPKIKSDSKKYGIAIADPTKYVKKEEKEETFGEELKSYSVAQWDNLKNGNKLESPPTPKLNIPKIKFEKTQN